MGEAAEADLTLARGMIEQNQAGTRFIACPLKLSDSPAAESRPAPALGQDSDQVLRRAGISQETIAQLREQGILAG